MPADREQLRETFRRYADTRDLTLRDQLVEAHMGLAAYLARRFANRGQPLEDLTQVAALGLLKAVERFDPSLKVEFSTYATTTIVGELKRYLRDRGWAVRAPRRMQELYLTLSRVVDPLGQELGRSPTIGELAAEVGASEEEVLEALEAGQAYRFASLDAPRSEGEGDTVGEAMGGEDDELARAEQRALLAPMLAHLPARQRQIVHLRFFEGLTQSEIARRLGISQMQVSRLLSRSVAQMRSLAKEPSGEQ
ncbi:MAG TPA: SigB/SigF/SigG family RNA polymerase sigma factor [Acidimicrobiales bacterium]|nr:SigB/SigF/SigG family RNA polymerase sigma factor [Acidimicrobiales bacterium]